MTAPEPPAAEPLALLCPYCQTSIEVTTSSVGGYYRETVVEAIECDNSACGATWSAHDGSPIVPGRLAPADAVPDTGQARPADEVAVSTVREWGVYALVSERALNHPYVVEEADDADDAETMAGSFSTGRVCWRDVTYGRWMPGTPPALAEPSGDTGQAPDVAALLAKCDEIDRQGHSKLRGTFSTADIRALLGTDTTPEAHA